MNRQDVLEEIVACPKCFGRVLIHKDRLKCEKCRDSYVIRDNKYYFIDSINNRIIAKEKGNLTDPQNWTEWRKKNFLFFQKTLVPCLDSDKLVVDLGAGQGHFSELFNSTKYVSVDFYPYDNIDFVTDFTQKLPFRSNSVDYIVLSNVMEHLSEPEILLKECFRIMKSNSKIFVTVPFIIGLHQQPYDFLRYTHFMLQYLFKKAEFVEIHIEELGNIFDVYTVLMTGYFKRVRKTLSETKKSSTAISRGVLKLLEMIHRYSFLLMRDIFVLRSDRDIEGSMNYPHGYGVVARKP